MPFSVRLGGCYHTLSVGLVDLGFWTGPENVIPAIPLQLRASEPPPCLCRHNTTSSQRRNLYRIRHRRDQCQGRYASPDVPSDLATLRHEGIGASLLRTTRLCRAPDAGQDHQIACFSGLYRRRIMPPE